MHIDDSRAAVRRYVLRTSVAHDDSEPELPDDCGAVHAILLDPGRAVSQRHSDVIEFVESSCAAPEAACGLRVRAILPMAFDTNDPGVCPQCSELAIVRQTDPNEFRRRIAIRAERRRQRGDVDRYLAVFRQRKPRRGAADRRR